MSDDIAIKLLEDAIIELIEVREKNLREYFNRFLIRKLLRSLTESERLIYLEYGIIPLISTMEETVFGDRTKLLEAYKEPIELLEIFCAINNIPDTLKIIEKRCRGITDDDLIDELIYRIKKRFNLQALDINIFDVIDWL